MGSVILVCFVIAVVLAIYFYRKKKKLNLADVSMITGGVKTGKTTLTFSLARRKYKQNHFKWRIKYFICKLFKKPLPEEPLFYCNVPVKWTYVPVTADILLRKKRINYKSVMYLQEASLIADGFDWKDDSTNEALKLFNKLYGHETKGGSLFYDTQCIRDVHFAIKRSLNTYIWIQSAIKWIPFIYICKVREMYYSDEQGVVNTFNEDVEDTTKWLLVPKSIWRYFDCYCYSVLTDDLPVEDKEIYKVDSLKCDKILTVKKGGVYEIKK
jgi:hypothetical protein